MAASGPSGTDYRGLVEPTETWQDEASAILDRVIVEAERTDPYRVVCVGHEWEPASHGFVCSRCGSAPSWCQFCGRDIWGDGHECEVRR